MPFVYLTPNESCVANYGYGETKLEKDKTYIIHDSWVGKIPGTLSFIENDFKPYNISIDANNKSILFIRTIGGGDILVLSGLVKYIKDLYPSCKICFTCIKEQNELAQMIDGIDSVYPMPMNANEFKNFDYHVSVSGLIEGNRSNTNRNIYDVYLESIGVPLNDEKVALIDDKYKRPNLKDLFSGINPNEKLIGFHPFAHDPIRQMDPLLANSIAKTLIDHGYTVLMFSSQRERDALIHIFDSRIRWMNNFSYSSTAMLLRSCRIVISVDSLITHLAQGLGVHTFAVYGPFDPMSRIKYYKNITILDNNPVCRCSLHNVGECPKGFKNSPCMNLTAMDIIRYLNGSQISFDLHNDPIVKTYTTLFGKEYL